MALFLADLHSFIIYSYVGTAIILASVYLLFKVLKTTSPRLKAWSYFSALAVPPITYIIAHLLLRKPCNFGRLPWDIDGVTQAYNAMCRLGAKITDFLVPFFGIALFIGVAKGIISIIACRRLVTQYGYLSEEDAPDVFEMLQYIADQTGIAIPKLIVIPSEKIKAFTFGIKQPVIVVSEGVFNELSLEDLEHILKHECAHIKRNDVLTNWLAVMIRDISFFNPFTQWAFSLYVASKEEASDDVAVRTGLNPYEYGATLIKMWRKSKDNTLSSIIFNNISPNPGFLKKAASFEERVSRMLSWQENTTEPKSFGVFFTLILIFSITILALIC